MAQRYLENPHTDYISPETTPVYIDEKHVTNLICKYVDAILESGPDRTDKESRGDLYLGNAGIAYMFWKMARSKKTKTLYPALEHAQTFIRAAKADVERNKRRFSSRRYSFLCGPAGTYAVSAAISYDLKYWEALTEDLTNFKAGIEQSKDLMHSTDIYDEMLVGRAGYLSGCYWLNDVLKTKAIADDDITCICQAIIGAGREYAKKTKTPLPLMYQYHGTEYLGAAHGLCAILHMLLESSWFRTNPISASRADQRDIKDSIDFFLSLQDKEGNFPISLEDLKTKRAKRLVHWCHGAPGAIYLLAKAFLIFRDVKYLHASQRCADLIWEKGFLRKGPGICHGVAGNGYAFLLLYRLTCESKYLYRAAKFMSLLTDSKFKQEARTPDHPLSLYEGVAGTVCFLIDLLEPMRAQFPFMDVFH